MPPKPVIIIAGLVYDPIFQACIQIAENLEQEIGHKQNVAYDYNDFFERQFEDFISKKKIQNNHFQYTTEQPFITYQGNTVGGINEFISLIEKEFSYKTDITGSEKTFTLRAQRAFKEKLRRSGNIAVYQDIQIGTEVSKGSKKKIVYLLNSSTCPLAAENFKCLCTGEKGGKLKYKGTPFHRVVKDGWIQSGDIVTGGGDGGWSIYGEFFNDESFSMKFDSAGVLAYANDGPHTNSSQFFITVDSMEWMNEKAVAFGEVVSGLSIINEINNVPLANERPLEDCFISSSGLYDLEFTDEEKEDLATNPPNIVLHA